MGRGAKDRQHIKVGWLLSGKGEREVTRGNMKEAKEEIVGEGENDISFKSMQIPACCYFLGAIYFKMFFCPYC